MTHGSLYIIDAFDFDFDSDPDYNDSDSDFCCFDIVFMEPAPEEVVVVVELREADGIAVDIGKVVVRTKRWLHMDKESTP